MKPYYDHDFIWAQRRVHGNPVWGGSSHWVYRQILSRLADYPTQEKSILDVGCGAGAFGGLAMAEGYRYLGVDASRVGIELGQQHYPGVKLAVADFATADLSALSAEKFPIVTCVNVLHCLTGAEERNQLLKNLWKASTPEAILVLTTMIGPVAEDAVEKRLPRAYKTADAISLELALNGWSSFLYTEATTPNAFSKIGNMMVLCKKC